MAGRLRHHPEFELISEPQLNLLLYRYVPEPLRERARAGTLERIQAMSRRPKGPLPEFTKRRGEQLTWLMLGVGLAGRIYGWRAVRALAGGRRDRH